MAQSHDTHVIITPFWKGVITGFGLVFAWHNRGWIFSLVRKAWNFHGTGLLAGAATGIDMPNADPSIAFRQMRRYAFAAAQDKSPIVGLTHASYALIALDILEEAVGRDALMAKGCDVAKIRMVVTALQDGHAKRLEACDPFLAQALAMERGEPGGALPGGVFAGVEYSAPTGA